MSLSRRTIILSGVGLMAVAACVAFALVYRAPIERVARAERSSLSAALVEKGATLATIGDCVVCHTKEGGPAYAGGRALATPFGTLYATNITPDEETGIGSWSSAAFRRAMREGVSRDGTHLYPALPYEHFTHVSDEDLDALHAYLMSRPAVSAKAPPNDLIFPLGFRPLLAGWKLLFLHGGAFQRDPEQSDEWNRGAYLVEGLAHCGGCHAPRNLAGGEKRGEAFAGGVAEGWNAPALDGSNPSLAAWTPHSLFDYLRQGIEAHHSAAAGPMGPVAHGLSEAPEADVRAISVYIASLMHKSPTAKDDAPIDRQAEAAREHPLGGDLFTGACGGCHGGGAPMLTAGRPSLSLVGAVQEDDPRNAIQAILQGIEPPTGANGPYMPAFAASLKDEEIAEIAAYLRARFSGRQAWPRLKDAVAAARMEAASQ